MKVPLYVSLVLVLSALALGQGRPTCPPPTVATLEWQEDGKLNKAYVDDTSKVVVGDIPSQVTVTLTAVSRLTVDGDKSETLGPKHSVSLAPGSYLIEILVNAKDGKRKVYKTIYRFDTRPRPIAK
ncbi:MAG TPA: hypothetical protein VMQ44_01015 [Candidatus Saccharimonadales bacterium]|nr:hypothetical protein [Candidatus Saccharimonadales bacterium]